jgi:hypothetical protein
MRLPTPSCKGYTEFIATVLVTITVLQYVGIFGSSGDIDLIYLVAMTLTLPVFTYLLTVASENVTGVSQWDRMVQHKG